MTAPQRVTGYNIYDDDSDVPTQHSLYEENRVFAYKSKFKDCRTNFIIFILCENRNSNKPPETKRLMVLEGFG